MTPDTFTPFPDYLRISQQEWTTQRPESNQCQNPSFSEHLSLADNRYSIIGTIHEDAHSRIYRVRDALLDRVLAIKQIDKSYPGCTTYLHQMKERTSLNHPNILRIYDIDEQQGQITMEFVQGRNLRDILKIKGSLALEVALYIAIQLVNGLNHAHNQGIVHHALIPEHLLLTRQCDLKIIAFRTPDSSLRKQQPELDKNAAYMPPEWFRKKKLATASNVYSFGVIMYEMLVGKPPFSAKQIATAMQKQGDTHLDEAVLPAGLNPILTRCLAIQPTHRETTIRAIGEQLIAWYKQCQPCKTDAEHLNTYKDFLLMAWADGKITEEEAAFLAHKRQELSISEKAAQKAEAMVKQELKQLMRDA